MTNINVERKKRRNMDGEKKDSPVCVVCAFNLLKFPPRYLVTRWKNVKRQKYKTNEKTVSEKCKNSGEA